MHPDAPRCNTLHVVSCRTLSPSIADVLLKDSHESDGLTRPARTCPRRSGAAQLRAGQVLVRVTHSGVCGTDLKIYNGAIPVGYPRIMGHEMTGEVVDAGGNESSGPATASSLTRSFSAASCFHCRIGQTHLCPNGQLLGRDANGGFAEYVAAPASHVFRLARFHR